MDQWVRFLLERLFVAGIIPGIIMMFALMITVNITAKEIMYQ